jgi:hypothetical protein
VLGAVSVACVARFDRFCLSDFMFRFRSFLLFCLSMMGSSSSVSLGSLVSLLNDMLSALLRPFLLVVNRTRMWVLVPRYALSSLVCAALFSTVSFHNFCFDFERPQSLVGTGRVLAFFCHPLSSTLRYRKSALLLSVD